MKHVRYSVVAVAAFGLMLASISPVAAGGPDYDKKSSSDREREGSKQGQSWSRHDHDNGRKDHEKVTICHRTGSASNPYVKITIAKEGMNGHTAHGDIVFTAGAECPRPVATPQAVNDDRDHKDGDKDCWKWDASNVSWTRTDAKQFKAHQVSHANVEAHTKVVYIVQPVIVQPVGLDVNEDATAALTAGAHSEAMTNDVSASTAMTAAGTAADPGTTPVLTLAPAGMADPEATSAVAGAMDLPAVTETGTDAQQVVPADAGSGVDVAGAATGALLGLSILAMAVVFGSRWLTAKR